MYSWDFPFTGSTVGVQSLSWRAMIKWAKNRSQQAVPANGAAELWTSPLQEKVCLVRAPFPPGAEAREVPGGRTAAGSAVRRERRPQLVDASYRVRNPGGDRPRADQLAGVREGTPK
jgi:hypothetical protein